MSMKRNEIKPVPAIISGVSSSPMKPYQIKRLQKQAARLAIGPIALCSLCGLGIACFGLYSLHEEFRHHSYSLELVSRGRTAKGVVISCYRREERYGKRRRVEWHHAISFEGHKKNLQRKTPLHIGTTLPVIFLEEDMPLHPDRARIGKVGESPEELRGSLNSATPVVFATIFFGALLLVGLFMSLGLPCIIVASTFRARKQLRELGLGDYD